MPDAVAFDYLEELRDQSRMLCERSQNLREASDRLREDSQRLRVAVRVMPDALVAAAPRSEA